MHVHVGLINPVIHPLSMPLIKTMPCLTKLQFSFLNVNMCAPQGLRDKYRIKFYTTLQVYLLCFNTEHNGTHALHCNVINTVALPSASKANSMADRCASCNKKWSK